MRRVVSSGKKPKVQDRKYLRPSEARRLIEAAGKRGRYPFRDKVLIRMVYRHGLRASEAVGMRWSHVDLEQGVIHIARVKGSNDSTHSLDRDELRDLRKLRQQVTGLYVFETERGGPLSVDRRTLSDTPPPGDVGWPLARGVHLCIATRVRMTASPAPNARNAIADPTPLPGSPNPYRRKPAR